MFNKHKDSVCKFQKQLQSYGVKKINLFGLSLEYWKELVNAFEIMYKVFPILNGIIYGVSFQCGQLGNLANIKRPLSLEYQYDRIIYPQIYVNNLGRSKRLYNFCLNRSKKLGLSQNNTFKTIIMHEIAHILEMQLIIKQYNLDFNTEDESIKQEYYNTFCQVNNEARISRNIFYTCYNQPISTKKIEGYSYATKDKLYSEVFAEMLASYYGLKNPNRDVILYAEEAQHYIKTYIHI